ncbi:MAG TPA: peptidoglycan-binding domain-containing protein [Candidatus Binatia bacterium]
MDKILSFVLVSLFISACATVIEEKDSQTAETQAVPAPETQVVETASSSTDSVKHESDQLHGAASRTLRKQEIRSLQSQLKAAGFDPGPLDGVLGAKTTSALRRLQLGCANLNDLLDNPDFGTFQQSGGMQTAKQSAPDRTFGADETRLIQVRLKEAGFDGGPIDGVIGSRTKSALFRFQSGCAIVKDLPAYLKTEPQTAERLPNPTSSAEKQSQAALSKSSQAVASTKDEAGKMNVATVKTPSRDEVRLLQTQLKAAGFDPGPFDGLLGPRTQSALQQHRVFQGSRKPVSGVGLKY